MKILHCPDPDSHLHAAGVCVGYQSADVEPGPLVHYQCHGARGISALGEGHFSVLVVPEPPTGLLLAFGLVMLAILRHFSRR